LRFGVVGSGPAGIAAATTLLRAGHEVEVLDWGNVPEASSRALAQSLREVILEGRELPRQAVAQLRLGQLGVTELLRRIPAAATVRKATLGSHFVFADTTDKLPVTGAQVVRSLARGGLSNVWGAACYPLTTADYDDWPITETDMAKHYRAAAEMMGLREAPDALEAIYRLYAPENHGANLSRNPGSPIDDLVPKWASNESLLTEAGLSVGRSRLAVNLPGSADANCRQCGLCTHGCPFGSIYVSIRTLEQLMEQPKFTYVRGIMVEHFRETESDVIVGSRRRSGERFEATYDAVFLAGGTLGTLQLSAASLGAENHSFRLLDNDMFIVPFWISHSIPREYQSRFGLSESAIAIQKEDDGGEGVHLQLYSYNDSFIGAARNLITALPRPANRLARALLNRVAIGAVYLNGRESRHAEARIVRAPDGTWPLRVTAIPNELSRLALRRTLRRLEQSRHSLGLKPIRSLVRATPFGFSSHLAGTFPMRKEASRFETNSDGTHHGHRRVFVVDGSIFPALPAQNPTYTIVANAMRVADGAARTLALISPPETNA